MKTRTTTRMKMKTTMTRIMMMTVKMATMSSRR